MDNLNNIPNAGNWGDAASKLNDNFNKIKQSLTTVENTSKNNKGYFTSLSALNTAFPSPKAGQTAYVYSEASSTKYYTYNAVNGAWVTSSVEAPAVAVNIADYTKSGGSSKTTKQVEDEIVQLAGETIPISSISNLSFDSIIPISPDKWEHGYLDIDGFNVSSTSYIRTISPILIKPNTYYEFGNSNIGVVALRVLDASGNVVQSVSKPANTGVKPEFKTSANAASVKVYTAKHPATEITTDFIKESGVFLREKKPNLAHIEEINDSIQLLDNILLPKPELWEHGYLDSDGFNVPSTSYIRTISPILIKPNTYYEIGNNNIGVVSLRILDASGNVVQSVSKLANTSAKPEFKTSANASSVKVYTAKHPATEITTNFIKEAGVFLSEKKYVARVDGARLILDAEATKIAAIDTLDSRVTTLEQAGSGGDTPAPGSVEFITNVVFDSLINTNDVFQAGVGTDKDGNARSFVLNLVNSIVHPSIRATNLSGTVRILSRNKNIFDASRVDKGNFYIYDKGDLQADKTLVSVFEYLKAGNYRLRGWENTYLGTAAYGGVKPHLVIFNKQMTKNSHLFIENSAPAVLVMPVDGWIATSVSDADLNTFIIEKGTTDSDYIKGDTSELIINLGNYDDGTPFVLRKNGNVADEIIYTASGYVRIQRVGIDGSMLSSPIAVFSGESEFSVSGTLSINRGNEITVVASGVVEIEINYPLSIESRNLQLVDEVKKTLKSLDEANKQLLALRDVASHFGGYEIESWKRVHFSGERYSSFSSGAMIKGKEVYIVRTANHHETYSSTRTALVFYVRESNGKFTPKILNLTDYAEWDYRDPNLTATKNGKYLILTTTGFLKSNTATRKSLYILIDSDLNIVSSHIISTNRDFVWGNSLETPTGKILKAAYFSDAESTSLGGARLYKSTGSYENPGSFTQISVPMPVHADNFTEPTICYLGSKLVMIARANTGVGAMTWTGDLEGASGWQPLVRLPFIVHAPSVEPYIPAKNPLILAFSSYEVGQQLVGNRRPAFSATTNLQDWSDKAYLVDSIARAGGYTSFVKNRYGYGVMWYDERVGSGTYPATSLIFHDVDIERFIPLSQMIYQLSQ